MAGPELSVEPAEGGGPLGDGPDGRVGVRGGQPGEDRVSSRRDAPDGVDEWLNTAMYLIPAGTAALIFRRPVVVLLVAASTSFLVELWQAATNTIGAAIAVAVSRLGGRRG